MRLGARLRMLVTVALTLASAACGRGDDASPRRNLLVVTIDTLRRDAVGFEGGPVTPALDALAAQSTVFDDAFTVAPVTLPAHTSILTGLYPASHGARDNGPMRVPSGVTTLAERLRARGWRTLAAVSAVVLDPCFGLDQGFERYESPYRPIGGASFNVSQRRGAETVDALLRLLDEPGGEPAAPWFAWLHLYDPHTPHDAPGARPDLPTRQAYDAEVAYVDGEIARLVAELKRRELWDDTVVVVASDHGEGLDDGREPTHGFSLHDTTMRVPLLVRDPRRAPSRVGAAVSLVDVTPTALELLDVAARPDEFDGRSLVALMDGGTAPARTLLLESYLPWISCGWAPFEGGVDAAHKVIRSHGREAYDRALDPGEEHDVAGGSSASVEAMFSEVDARMAALPGHFEGEEAETDAEMSAMLQSLGYAGAREVVGIDARPPFDALPDPYEKRALMDRMNALSQALVPGQSEAALVELRALVELDPENAVFLERLGEALIFVDAAANVDEAERVLARAVALRPGRAGAHLSLASCAHVHGDETTVERELRTVLSLEADHPVALYNLSSILTQRGRLGGPDAKATFVEALGLVERLLARLPETDPRRAELTQTRTYLGRQIERR